MLMFYSHFLHTFIQADHYVSCHKCLSKQILHSYVQYSLSQELHIPPGFRGTYECLADVGLSKKI